LHGDFLPPRSGERKWFSQPTSTTGPSTEDAASANPPGDYDDHRARVGDQAPLKVAELRLNLKSRLRQEASEHRRVPETQRTAIQAQHGAIRLGPASRTTPRHHRRPTRPHAKTAGFDRLASRNPRRSSGSTPPNRAPVHAGVVEFADAVRRHRYIGACFGAPGLGKTLSARTYGAADDWERWVDNRYTREVELPLSIAAARTAVLTPTL